MANRYVAGVPSTVPVPNPGGGFVASEYKQETELQLFSANERGHDLIVGDIHGAYGNLEKLLQAMGPNDRLFIVGDLADRGENSIGVYRSLMDRKDKGTPPPIIIVRGNHEDDLLALLSAVENPSDLQALQNRIRSYASFDRKHLDTSDPIQNFVSNGGQWLADPTVTFNDVQRMKKFISDMPYVATVKGTEKKSSFHVVHADLPFTDEELDLFRSSGKKLNAETKDYLNHARKKEGDIRNNRRNQFSTPVYCGHTILEGARLENNHWNLDMVILQLT